MALSKSLININVLALSNYNILFCGSAMLTELVLANLSVNSIKSTLRYKTSIIVCLGLVLNLSEVLPKYDKMLVKPF